ncbi:MAG: cytochrome c oxidase subunit II [Caldilineaceae bacterium]|nr:cytochrome c oxidase subunit II [Caldilineaceae bacterium]
MQNNTRHFTAIGVLIVIFTYLVYLVLDNVLKFPLSGSTQAVAIDGLIQGHLWLIAFLFSLVVVFMVYALFLFRRREGDESEGQHFHGHTGLEIAWTVIPMIVVIGFGYWATLILIDITAPQDNEVIINARGQQWSWQFSLPNSDEVATELVLPVGRPIRMDLNSTDVLHSFWVPEFRVKEDVVPGRTTHLRFTPTVEGEYRLICAELCGLNHTGMIAKVRVVPQEEFAAFWNTAIQTASSK